MALASRFLARTLSPDDLECSKEVCRSILETVDSTEVQLQAWEDVAASLAKASLARECWGFLHVDACDLESLSISIRSVAPRSGRGEWSKQYLHLHPRKEILLDELEVLVSTLQALQDLPEQKSDENEAPDASQAEVLVLTDALALIQAFKGCA